MAADWLAALLCVPLYGSMPLFVSLGQGAAHPYSYLFWARLGSLLSCLALLPFAGDRVTLRRALRSARPADWRLWCGLGGALGPLIYSWAAALAPLTAVSVLAETWPLWMMVGNGAWRRLGQRGIPGLALAVLGSALAAWYGAGGSVWNWTPGVGAGMGIALLCGCGSGVYAWQSLWCAQTAIDAGGSRAAFRQAVLLASCLVYFVTALTGAVLGGGVSWHDGAAWAALQGVVATVANSGLMFIARPGRPGPALACCGTPFIAGLLGWIFSGDRTLIGLAPFLAAGALVSLGSILAGRADMLRGLQSKGANPKGCP